MNYKQGNQYSQYQRTSPQCRNGPINQRSCTNCICILLYLLLLGAVIFLVLFSAGGVHKTPQQISNQLLDNKFGSPLLAIIQAKIPIVVSVAFVAALCIILVITTFIIPAIVTYIYIPVFLVIMLLGGIAALYRYFGQKILFVSQQIQQNFIQSRSIVTLIVGIAFLLGFFISIVTLCSKKQKFSNIQPVLRIARCVFWPNFYMLIFSIFFSILSLAALICNIALLGISLTRKDNIVHPYITAGLVILQALVTHGILQALSDFFFQSIAIHWYYNQRRKAENQQSICDTLCLTFKMMFKHFGTIINGWILAYIPQTLNTFIGKMSVKSPCCYNTFCLWHRCTFRNLTKYCYIETIMQNYSFSPANDAMFQVRKRTKAILPDIYMMGNFYMSLAKIFCVMCGLIICYFLIVNSNVVHIMATSLNLLGPLIIVLFCSLQMCNHFMNSTGLIGDTIVFCYSIDLQIQKKNFGQLVPYSCPQNVQEIIHEVKAGKYFNVYDS